MVHSQQRSRRSIHLMLFIWAVGDGWEDGWSELPEGKADEVCRGVKGLCTSLTISVASAFTPLTGLTLFPVTQLGSLHFVSRIFALMHQTEEQNQQTHCPLWQARDRAPYVCKQKDHDYYLEQKMVPTKGTEVSPVL